MQRAIEKNQRTNAKMNLRTDTKMKQRTNNKMQQKINNLTGSDKEMSNSASAILKN